MFLIDLFMISDDIIFMISMLGKNKALRKICRLQKIFTSFSILYHLHHKKTVNFVYRIKLVS